MRHEEKQKKFVFQGVKKKNERRRNQKKRKNPMTKKEEEVQEAYVWPCSPFQAHS